MPNSKTYPGLARDSNPASNWVEKAGGLPSYIERIAKHIHYEGGKSISHAIAAAVNTVKRWAAGGTTREHGGQKVSAATQAKAAKAVAEWEAKKGKAKAMGIDDEADLFLALERQIDEEGWLELADEPLGDADQDLDEGSFKLHLAQARSARGLEHSDYLTEGVKDGMLGVLMAPTSLTDPHPVLTSLDLGVKKTVSKVTTFDWDPNEHPRDLLGRFKKALYGTPEGGAVELPGGTKVEVRRARGVNGMPIKSSRREYLVDGDTGEDSVDYSPPRNATEAAIEGLEANALSDSPDSLGGSTPRNFQGQLDKAGITDNTDPLDDEFDKAVRRRLEAHDYDPELVEQVVGGWDRREANGGKDVSEAEDITESDRAMDAHVSAIMTEYDEMEKDVLESPDAEDDGDQRLEAMKSLLEDNEGYTREELDKMEVEQIADKINEAGWTAEDVDDVEAEMAGEVDFTDYSTKDLLREVKDPDNDPARREQAYDLLDEGEYDGMDELDEYLEEYPLGDPEGEVVDEEDPEEVAGYLKGRVSFRSKKGDAFDIKTDDGKFEFTRDASGAWSMIDPNGNTQDGPSPFDAYDSWNEGGRGGDTGITGVDSGLAAEFGKVPKGKERVFVASYADGHEMVVNTYGSPEEALNDLEYDSLDEMEEAGEASLVPVDGKPGETVYLVSSPGGHEIDYETMTADEVKAEYGEDAIENGYAHEGEVAIAEVEIPAGDTGVTGVDMPEGDTAEAISAGEWFEAELEAMNPEDEDGVREDFDPDELAEYRKTAGQIAIDNEAVSAAAKPTPEGDGVILNNGTVVRITEDGEIVEEPPETPETADTPDPTPQSGGFKVGDVVRHADSEDKPDFAMRVVKQNDDGTVDVVGPGAEGVGHELVKGANPADMQPAKAKMRPSVTSEADRIQRAAESGLPPKEDMYEKFDASGMADGATNVQAGDGYLEFDNKHDESHFIIEQDKKGKWVGEGYSDEDDYTKPYVTIEADDYEGLLETMNEWDPDKLDWAEDHPHFKALLSSGREPTKESEAADRADFERRNPPDKSGPTDPGPGDMQELQRAAESKGGRVTRHGIERDKEALPVDQLKQLHDENSNGADFYDALGTSLGVTDEEIEAVQAKVDAGDTELTDRERQVSLLTGSGADAYEWAGEQLQGEGALAELRGEKPEITGVSTEEASLAGTVSANPLEREVREGTEALQEGEYLQIGDPPEQVAQIFNHGDAGYGINYWDDDTGQWEEWTVGVSLESVLSELNDDNVFREPTRKGQKKGKK